MNRAESDGLQADGNGKRASKSPELPLQIAAIRDFLTNAAGN